MRMSSVSLLNQQKKKVDKPIYLVTIKKKQDRIFNVIQPNEVQCFLLILAINFRIRLQLFMGITLNHTIYFVVCRKKTLHVQRFVTISVQWISNKRF